MIRVIYDGDTSWLECFATRPNATRGVAFHPITAGDTWHELVAEVAKHEALHGCGVEPVSPDLDVEARAEVELAVGELAAAADVATTLTALAEWIKRHEDERIVTLLTREADEQSEDGFPVAAAFAAHLAERVYQRTTGVPSGE